MELEKAYNAKRHNTSMEYSIMLKVHINSERKDEIDFAPSVFEGEYAFLHIHDARFTDEFSIIKFFVVLGINMYISDRGSYLYSKLYTGNDREKHMELLKQAKNECKL